jgi:hypothetical protein
MTKAHIRRIAIEIVLAGTSQIVASVIDQSLNQPANQMINQNTTYVSTSSRPPECKGRMGAHTLTVKTSLPLPPPLMRLHTATRSILAIVASNKLN